MAPKKLKKQRVVVVAGATLAFFAAIFSFMAFEYARFFQFNIVTFVSLMTAAVCLGTALHGWLRDRIKNSKRAIFVPFAVVAVFAPYFLTAEHHPEKCQTRILSRAIVRPVLRVVAILEDVCRVRMMTESCHGLKAEKSSACYRSALASVSRDPDFTDEGKSVMFSIYESRSPGSSARE